MKRLVLALLLSPSGGSAEGIPTKDRGAEVVMPPGWAQEPLESTDDVFQMVKGVSVFTLGLVKDPSEGGGVCEQLKAQRARMAELGKAPKPLGVFQGGDMTGCLFTMANKDASLTIQGYIRGQLSTYSFVLNNSSLETFSKILEGVKLKGNGGPTRSRLANAAIAALPKEPHPLGPLAGRFLGPHGGYRLAPVTDRGLLVKAQGLKILFEGERFSPPGPKRDKEVNEFLNAKGEGLAVDPARCKPRGLLPVSAGSARWMFRLFDCAGDTDTIILGTLEVGKTILSAQGRASDGAALKRLTLWAQTAEFEPVP